MQLIVKYLQIQFAKYSTIFKRGIISFCSYICVYIYIYITSSFSTILFSHSFLMNVEYFYYLFAKHIEHLKSMCNSQNENSITFSTALLPCSAPCCSAPCCSAQCCSVAVHRVADNIRVDVDQGR